MTSREFNQDTGRAKKATKRGPVFITDRGRPAHVLLTFEQYQSLVGQPPNIVELLAMPDAGKLEFEPPRVGALYRTADLDD